MKVLAILLAVTVSGFILRWLYLFLTHANYKPLIRWMTFIFIGYPFQILFNIIYPFLHLYWRLFIYKKFTEQKLPQHESVSLTDYPIMRRINMRLLDNTDDHGAFTMYGAIDAMGLGLLQLMGNVIRRYDDHGKFNQKQVSGDVLVAWCFAATHHKVNLNNLEHTIRMMAWTYLKNLGVCSYDSKNRGWVSNRCNNFGINYCPDSDVVGLGQPMAGPQFYTSSALFALASTFSVKWKIVFWLHFIFMGGFIWMFSPVIYTNDKPVHYAKDITMKALWVHKFVFGDKFWIRWPMKFITYTISEYKNALFYAILGHNNWVDLPEVMNAFFSQKADATSRHVPNDMNPYLSTAIKDLMVRSSETP